MLECYVAMASKRRRLAEGPFSDVLEAAACGCTRMDTIV